MKTPLTGENKGVINMKLLKTIGTFIVEELRRQGDLVVKTGFYD